MSITLSDPVAAFTEKIAQPFDDAAAIVRQIADLYNTSNQQLQKHQQELTVTFKGIGANAFTDMIAKQINWVDGIASHTNELAGLYETCARDVRLAAQEIERLISPFLDIVEWVLDRLTPDIVVRDGESAVQSVFNDMRSQLEREMHDASGFFSSIIHGHFGTALHDAVDGVKGLAHLGGDVLALVADVEPILCQWAANVYQAVNWLLNRLNGWCLVVLDWLLGISDIADATTVFGDPNSSTEEKWLAGVEIGVNVLMDIGLFIPGADIFALLAKGGFKLLGKFGLKELLSAAMKRIATRITEMAVAQMMKELVRRFVDKLALKYSEFMIQRMLKRGLTAKVLANLQKDLLTGLLPRVDDIIIDYMSGNITKEEAKRRIAYLMTLAEKYTPDQLRTILRVPDLNLGAGLKVVYSNGNEGVAHVLDKHVGKDSQYLLDRLKGMSQGSASTFTDEQTAQEAVDGAIASLANNRDFQQFLRDARPGTTFPPKNINPPIPPYYPDPPQNLGWGYQKIPLSGRGAIVRKFTNLPGVRIVVAIGPDGKPFILTAYPVR